MKRSGGLTKKQPLKAKTMLKKVSDKPTKRPKAKRAKLRDTADDWHSWYVRLRDCTFVDGEWIGTCITCTKTGVVAYLDPETAKKRPTGAIRFMIGWDNGHFVGRSNEIVRFEEENVNLQCKYHCNKMKNGNRDKYRVALKLKYGDEVPSKLERMADEERRGLTIPELEQIIADSKEQIKFMEVNHG